MKIASRPPLRRLLTIDRLIRDGSFPNASVLARELEVHPRTIHRDLDFLRNSWGVPVEFCPQQNGFHYADADFSLPLMRLSQGELIALFLAEQLLQQYAETPYAKQLASLFLKITLALPDEVTVDLSHLQKSYSVHHQKTSGKDAEYFAALARAVQECRQLQLDYWTASRDETMRRIVDPYHLASVQGDWYLIAYCHLREDIRMFSPGRIRKLKETGKTFERPDDFSIDEYLDHSFSTFRGDGQPITVRVRFAPELARHIREKQWHPRQKTRTQKDGSLIVTIKVNHLLEVKRWAMSYGSDCEVLEPPELREEIRRDLVQLWKTYDEEHDKKH